MADVGCRNTVFGAEAQEASSHLYLWRSVGIQHYRLEFAHESAAEVSEVALLFQQALSGAITPAQLNRKLKSAAPQGTTQGSLYVPQELIEISR
jgi:putative protease